MDDDFTRHVITLTRDPSHARSEELVRAHVAFLRELEREGRLVLAGPFEDGTGGMIIIRAKSHEAACAIAESDPFVISKCASAGVRTWLLSCEENDHLGAG